MSTAGISQGFSAHCDSVLWRLENGPELDSGWRLGVIGEHSIVQRTDDGAVYQHQTLGIQNCMRLLQLPLVT